jgi:hypothetical protein
MSWRDDPHVVAELASWKGNSDAVQDDVAAAMSVAASAAWAEVQRAVDAIPDLDIQGTAWIQTEHVLEMLSALSEENA